jgi:hypothetical protein
MEVRGDAMATETQTVMMTVSFPVLAIVGYLVSAVLLVAGRSSNRPPLVGSGLIVAGIVTVLLPLAYYGYEISRSAGPYPASLSDFLIVALAAFVSGLLIQMGIGYLRLTRSRSGTSNAPH